MYSFRDNGAKYRGYYEEGKKSGHGIFEYPDGSKYEGMLKKILLLVQLCNLDILIDVRNKLAARKI